jgi:hypothetical protein
MATYIQIGSTVTVGSGGAASIDFSSIPSTYTDLVLKFSLRDGTYASTLSTCYLKFNNSTTGRTTRWLFGNGTATGSGNASDMYLPNIPGNTATSSTFGNGELYIPNYAGSQNKSSSADVVPEENAVGTYMSLVANLWSNSAAINQITLTADGNLAQHSTATLYGIKKN